MADLFRRFRTQRKSKDDSNSTNSRIQRSNTPSILRESDPLSMASRDAAISLESTTRKEDAEPLSAIPSKPATSKDIATLYAHHTNRFLTNSTPLPSLNLFPISHFSRCRSGPCSDIPGLEICHHKLKAYLRHGFLNEPGKCLTWANYLKREANRWDVIRFAEREEGERNQAMVVYIAVVRILGEELRV
ncbi:hypothetical protein B0O99DRAFT_183662 [Bisporella sp. PMI_857]|nr:hypothetical protein B0O99DRAFT_183662 [Bisporella sp. PMI_857]